MATSPDKPISEVFRSMTDKLIQLQRNIACEMRIQNMLVTKIEEAVQNVPYCSQALRIKITTVIYLINMIALAIENHQAATKAERTSSTFLNTEDDAQHLRLNNFTDRRYNGNRPQSRPQDCPQNRNYPQHRGGYQQENNYERNGNKYRGELSDLKNKGTCLICKKYGCWSDQHSAEEQVALRKNTHDRYKGLPWSLASTSTPSGKTGNTPKTKLTE
ncbi:hypothetical protein BJ878DRAFT_129515 [Calycina marina]|uniref:Uncharacterized protein n=1 Tax=Calycina marina TaxID=1763456 RepID=A0A9P7Z991_9HELO|nr:hypothetical protein BJ878DRAFT_129515 [Calycina marina]